MPEVNSINSTEELEFFYSFPTWLIGTWAVGVWGGVVGSVLLLMRKSIAIWVFLASFLGALISSFRNYVLSNGLEVMGTAAAIGFTAGNTAYCLGSCFVLPRHGSTRGIALTNGGAYGFSFDWVN